MTSLRQAALDRIRPRSEVADDGAPGLSVQIETETGEPVGFLEVDRIVAGRSCGGVRITPTLSPMELRRSARVATLKNGYARVAAGGLKAGILLQRNADPAQRLARLEAFGRALGPFLRDGICSLGHGLGAKPEDVLVILRAAGLPVSSGFEQNNGPPTGLTVALATLAALRARAIDPSRARVCIQGAGAVGRATMSILHREGVRVVAAATSAGTLVRESGLDVDALLEGARRGDSFVAGAGTRSPRAVLDVECDVLIPCAGSGTIDAAAAANLPTSIVVCGANDPFAAGTEERLRARHVLVVPDFVANGGGVLGSTLASAVGATPREIDALMRRHFLPRVAATLDLAAKLEEPVAEPARRQALRFLAECDQVYGWTRPPSLLPEALAPPPSPGSRILLALERRARGSRKLAPLGRRLRPLALQRVDGVLRSALVVGTPAI
jgi:glutamate dehydrogenase (NAD(P)+)